MAAQTKGIRPTLDGALVNPSCTSFIDYDSVIFTFENRERVLNLAEE